MVKYCYSLDVPMFTVWQIEAVYLFTEGNASDGSFELLKRKVKNKDDRDNNDAQYDDDDVL